MRRYVATHSFEKRFQKLPIDIREHFIERVEVFISNPVHPLLHDHALTGEWTGHRSINVTGDYRAIYRELVQDVYEFVAIGTHHQLFGR